MGSPPNSNYNSNIALCSASAKYEATGIPVGMGISPEIDSEIANGEVIWSFGGSIQDERGNPAFNSPETVAAVKYLAQLQNEAMTAEVFGFPGFSNPAIAQVYAEHIIPKVVAQAALGEATAEEAVAAAGARLDEIFAHWQSLGLVGAGG